MGETDRSRLTEPAETSSLRETRNVDVHVISRDGPPGERAGELLQCMAQVSTTGADEAA